MRTGKALIDEIDGTAPPRGELAFWWLGQHSFVVKLAGQVVYLDPFLSEMPSRTVRPPLAAAEITHAAVVTGSHDHGDHIDRAVWPALAAASPAAKFVVPELILRRGLAGDLGIPPERFIGLDDGAAAAVGRLTVTGVPSAHELLDRDEATGLHPYLGFVVEGGGVRLYHAGDTCNYEGLQTRLERLAPFDVMFLPINGRDAERLRAGCIGNLTYQEAVDLAGAIGPRLAVPAHFEMFEHNSEDPQRFVDYLCVKFPQVAPFVPRHGQTVLLRPGAEPETR
jgi:L-ascorbate 6-phosphate lactonase